MNPQQYNNETAPLKLPEVKVEQPEPDVEAPGLMKAAEKSVSQAIEHGSMATAGSQTVLPPVPTMPVNALPVINDPAAGNPVQPRKIPVVTADLIADDKDLIEKAWVEKAKAIVAQTKDDPYVQSNEITKIKEDYQQKRFKNKLKISE